MRIRLLGALDPVDHAYSHFRITLHAYHAEIETSTTATETFSGDQVAGSKRWILPEELDVYAFPTANRKLLVGLGSLPGSASPEV